MPRPRRDLAMTGRANPLGITAGLAVHRAACQLRPMWRRLLLLLAVMGVALAVIGYRNAQADPIIRRATVSLPNWPQGAPPMRVLLLSDVHAARPDMPLSRVARIVDIANAQNADAILIAGDIVSERWLQQKVPTKDVITTLGRLRAPLGVYAVYGNHDHWRGQAEVRRQLRVAGITALRDEAVKVGPITLGGIDDSTTDHSDFEGTLSKMRREGPRPMVMLSHGFDYFKFMPPDLPLLLAGHSHCGQITLPWGLGPKVPCGVVRGKGKEMIVTSGLGTSLVPMRFNAPPDMWVVTLGL